MIIGFTCGAFDLLHPGHLYLLAKAKDQCDHLLIGLHTDPTIDRPNTKNKPIQSVFERYMQLVNCSHVDEVVPYDSEKDLENLLATLAINKRFLGEEYKGTQITGEYICQQLDIEIIFIKRMHSYSSTELRNRLCNTSQHT
jgi:glycerol-3-phosphate cytidylyltransferase